jgi:hypothetical protein
LYIYGQGHDYAVIDKGRSNFLKCSWWSFFHI